MPIAEPLVSFYYRRLAGPILEARRRHYRRLFGVSRLDIYFPVFIESPNNVKLGENVSINAFTHIWANAPVEIGDNTMIAAHVQITSSTHDYTVTPMRDYRLDRPVTIGRNVWIGSGAIIFPGVSIGDNAVIGAGSLVLSDIPADSVAYGVPAVVKRTAADVD
jgi:maltose O-acetyltransferase